VPFTVVYDADVLYPAPLRDLLLQLATTGTFRAHYTEQILDEVFRNLAADRPDLDPDRLRATRADMETAIRGALITGHMPLVESVTLPDPDDRHVLAAAIRAGAQVIVTRNLRHYPAASLGEFDIEAQHPDVFVDHLADLAPALVVQALKAISARLRNPPKTPAEVLATLERSGLVQTAARVGPLL
jgi:predicted nucleic acid-binding protein